MYEQRANWTYSLSDLTPPLDGSTQGRFFQSAQSPGGLHAERVISREIGYMLMVPRLGMTLDVKLFDERLSDLISEKLQVSAFQPTNNGSLALTGLELQTSVEPVRGWTAFLNYAYLDSHGATNPIEQTQYSRHSGSLGVSHTMEGGMLWSLAYYGASGNGLGQNSYGRTDFTLAKTFTAHGARCRASATVSRLDNMSTTYFRDFGSTLESRFNDRVQIRGQLEVGF